MTPGKHGSVFLITKTQQFIHVQMLLPKIESMQCKTYLFSNDNLIKSMQMCPMRPTVEYIDETLVVERSSSSEDLW